MWQAGPNPLCPHPLCVTKLFYSSDVCVFKSSPRTQLDMLIYVNRKFHLTLIKEEAGIRSVFQTIRYMQAKQGVYSPPHSATQLGAHSSGRSQKPCVSAQPLPAARVEGGRVAQTNTIVLTVEPQWWLGPWRWAGIFTHPKSWKQQESQMTPVTAAPAKCEQMCFFSETKKKAIPSPVYAKC